MRKPFRYSLLLAFICLFSLNMFAPMPPPPPTTGGTPPCWPPPCIPVDGGISLLIVAGAAYAGKKLYDKRKKVNSSSVID